MGYQGYGFTHIKMPMIHLNIYDKRYDFDFEVMHFRIQDGHVHCFLSNVIHILQLIRIIIGIIFEWPLKTGFTAHLRPQG